MGARRFFVAGAHAPGDRVTIAGADAHKIANVLRLTDGDALEVVDSAARVYRAAIQAQHRDSVVVVLDGVLDAGGDDARFTITIAQGLPKGQKMDFVVEKLTELGVSGILPFTSQRSVARDPGDGKLERWRRLAQSAAQQSGRSRVPSIHEPLGYAELLQRFAAFDVVLVPWELSSGAPVRETLPPLVERARSILAVIGPEGGFSHDEAALAQDAGAHLISLGRRILRTETAGLVVAALLQYIGEQAS